MPQVVTICTGDIVIDGSSLVAIFLVAWLVRTKR